MLTLPPVVTTSTFQESLPGLREGSGVWTAMIKGRAPCCFWAAAREGAVWAEMPVALGPALDQPRSWEHTASVPHFSPPEWGQQHLHLRVYLRVSVALER